MTTKNHSICHEIQMSLQIDNALFLFMIFEQACLLPKQIPYGDQWFFVSCWDVNLLNSQFMRMIQWNLPE